ncbi:hypothetical protein [Lactiplantibacillus carotarum]|uniref:hypothetical protein n=1 Tax=Lactiplantibacillus carotarum TaxID=2993456 RepID=UPI00298EF384|nr:hypothetical protein [Lactiplantibacillus carotarum]
MIRAHINDLVEMIKYKVKNLKLKDLSIGWYNADQTLIHIQDLVKNDSLNENDMKTILVILDLQKKPKIIKYSLQEQQLSVSDFFDSLVRLDDWHVIVCKAGLTPARKVEGWLGKQEG